MSKKNNIEIKIDHNFHLQTTEVMEKWENRRGKEYKNYRKEWYENPKLNKLNNFPIHLDIEATSACNFLCTMCPRTEMIEDKTFWKVENFDFKKYTQIIDEGSKKGLRSIKFQYLGEPLVNKNLIKMIKYAKNAGIVDVMFNTNASLLTEKKSKEVILSGVDKVFFSFDSPYREEFNKIRVKGDYDKVLTNIKNFMRLKKELKSDTPITRVQMVLMKENQSQWEDFKKLFDGVVDTIAWVDYLDHGKQQSYKKKGTIGFNDKKKEFCCPQLWQRMFVHPDGVVTPCCNDSFRELKMGNINKNSIEEIWQNKKYQNIRKLHLEGKMKNIPLCAKCTYAKTS
ncbi:SPASM domain-containing protein [Pelagibacteraceae bacterium]|nr:SPASM domain-containing protein [Pelagibacteraceae bacterium]